MDSSNEKTPIDDFLDEEEAYEFVEVLGEGAYGKVTAVKHTDTDTLYAKKTIIFRQEELAECGIPTNAIREVGLLKQLDHPNLVKISEVIYEQPKLDIIMEYMNTDLKKYLKENHPLPLSKIQSIMARVLEGVKSMHSNRAIHRDLKPENIFLNSQEEVKIGDFGISRTYGASSNPMSPGMVTIFYRAPELALGVDEYSIPVDVWSCGCIFAELYSGRPLFQADSEIDLVNKIFKLRGTPTETTWPGITQRLSTVAPSYPDREAEISRMDELAKDLLNKMLCINPSHRITAKEALQHQYFEASY